MAAFPKGRHNSTCQHTDYFIFLIVYTKIYTIIYIYSTSREMAAFP